MGLRDWLKNVTKDFDGPEQQELVTQTKNLGKDLVIVVEDDEVASRIINATIQSMGLQTLCFVDARSCLSFIKDNPSTCPMAVVSDVMMDQGDGIDLLRALRKNKETAQVPFIFLSGVNREMFQTLIDEFVYEAFLQKPIEVGKLKQALDRVRHGDKNIIAA